VTRLQKILLIEDDEITNFLNKTIIESTGLVDDLVFASNGQEALDFLATVEHNQDYPNLILLDINMPVLDGFGFLEAFKKLPKNGKPPIEVVVLSTSSHPQDLGNMQSYGITTCLEKPLTEAAFMEVLAGIGHNMAPQATC